MHIQYPLLHAHNGALNWPKVNCLFNIRQQVHIYTMLNIYMLAAIIY